MLLRAVIIDDEQKGINTLKILIEKHIEGLKVVATSSKAMDGVDLIENYKPEIVFLDINMPEMDGLEATQIIRALPQPKRNIPIVALTAGAMSEDRERCLDAGMNSFISKPFRLEEIEGVLKKYVKVA